MIDTSVHDAGQYVFEDFNQGRSINDLKENSSLWQARVGLEFNF